ncbi:hypothetical protein BDC45DRAFT_237827 [Circinella umbellata]|nr:hypothetical protein BDC45DRAFT_237827 [Circinella umbellata]
MLHTLDDAKEQWLEQDQRFSNINTTHNNSKTAISSNTSPGFSSTITNTIINLDHYHSKQQQQTILSSLPSSPSPTPKPSSSQQLQRQQQPKHVREHSTNTTKQCHSCQSTETPEWRKGPMGPRTLCNACGLIWAKLARQQGISEGPDEEMTATIITTSPSSTTSSRNTSNTENNEGNKCALSYLLS